MKMSEEPSESEKLTHGEDRLIQVNSPEVGREDNSDCAVVKVTETVTGSHQVTDGGWGYVILGAVLVCFALLGGIHLCSTIIYEALLYKFEKSASVTSWVIGLQGFLGFVFSPVASMCCNRIGMKRTISLGSCLSITGVIASGFPPSLPYVYFTFGIMSGVGHSLVSTCIFAIVPMYFDKKLGKANAVASTGVNIGALVLAPLLTYWFNHYGYSGTMLLLGGMLGHMLVSAMLFRPVPRTEIKLNVNIINLNKSAENSKEKMTDNVGGNHVDLHESKITRGKLCQCSPGQTLNFSALRNIKFLGFAFSMLCMLIFFSLSQAFVGGLAKERSISDTLIAVILVVTSVCTIISRIIAGILFDINIIKKKRATVYCFLGLTSGAIYLFAPFTSTFASLLLVNATANSCGHALHSQHVTVINDMTGREMLVSSLGMARLLMGIGYFSGPIIGGALKDWSGTYDAAFYACGSIAIFGNLVFLTILCCIKPNS